MTRLFYGTGEFKVTEFRGRRALDEIEMLLSAFDCLLPDDSGVYCSSDVTTGRRLYFEIYARHGVRSDEELRGELGVEGYRRVMGSLVEENIARGVGFTDGLRLRGLSNLINPGPLHAPGFEQEHYYYLWESVIVRKVREGYFNEGWEYSSGCTLEYAICRRKGVPTLDHEGRDLPLADARARAERAVSELKARGVSAPTLERNLALIKELPE
jgi:hypothetical protein